MPWNVLRNFRVFRDGLKLPICRGRPYSVVIDYAHTPDGLENILKAVRGVS